MRLVLVLLFCAACRSIAPLQVDGCTGDSDCSMSILNTECCDRCTPEPGTAKSVAARNGSCDGRPGGPPRCPSLDCPHIVMVPKCVANRCTLEEKRP